MPGPGGYWLAPLRIASMAASSTALGPSVSGKPWPRLIEPVFRARADISAKIVVPKPESLSVKGVRVSGWAVTETRPPDAGARVPTSERPATVGVAQKRLRRSRLAG